MAVTAVCLLSISLIGSQAFAQGSPVHPPVTGQAGPAPNIALLDVSYIFKNHPRFKSMMDEMKADVDRAESDVNKERDTLRKLVEQMESYRKGTPEYKGLEEEIAKREADLSVRVQLQRKDFLARESKIYFTVYKEIEQEVNYYCTNKGIDMVLRFNGDPVDVDKPDSVLSFINKPVVYYDKGRDITYPILESLVKRSGAPAAGNTGNPGNRIGTPPVRPGAGSPFQK
jgi:outer membrane protein